MRVILGATHKHTDAEAYTAANTPDGPASFSSSIFVINQLQVSQQAWPAWALTAQLC